MGNSRMRLKKLFAKADTQTSYGLGVSNDMNEFVSKIFQKLYRTGINHMFLSYTKTTSKSNWSVIILSMVRNGKIMACFRLIGNFPQT